MSLTVAKAAAARTTLDAVRFAEVDQNGDGRLDFEEFLALQPAALRKERSDEDLRAWFDAVDTDASGSITLTEWFFWALGKEAARTANAKQDSIRAVFAKHDKDSTGFLDVAEFQMACYDLGFMVPAREIFRVLDEDNSGEVRVVRMQGVCGGGSQHLLPRGASCASEREVRGLWTGRDKMTRDRSAHASGIAVD